MVNRSMPTAPTLRWWLLGVLAAAALGTLASLSLPFTAGVVVIAAAGWAYVRTRIKAELVVGLFWIAFSAYQTVFSGTDISGFFYPFYGAFLAAFLVSLGRTGVRLPVRAVGLYAVFLFVVLVSLLAYPSGIRFEMLQRLLAYAFGVITVVQFGSRLGTRVVAVCGVIAASVVSTWVIVSAIRGGFQYRADISVDQNSVAFFVGLGVVILAAALVDRIVRRSPLGGTVALLLLFGAQLYAVLLLASRGITIALSLALVALIVRAVLEDRRTLVFVALLVAVAAGGFFLPGGQGLLQRFESDRVESASGRVPIWEHTLSSFAHSSAPSMLFGHGFDSSKTLVQRRFPSLTSTHNAYLELLYEFGVLGLASFLLLHVVVLTRARGVVASDAFLLVGLVAFLLAANLTVNAPDGFMYWTVLGFALAIATWAAPRPVPEPGTS